MGEIYLSCTAIWKWALKWSPNTQNIYMRKILCPMKPDRLYKRVFYVVVRTMSNNFANLSWYGSNNYRHYKIYSVLNHIDNFDIKPVCHRFSITLRYHVDFAYYITIYLCCLANYRLQISNNVRQNHTRREKHNLILVISKYWF